MAAILSSSVWAPFISATACDVAGGLGLRVGLVAVFSALEEFLAESGAFPDTYRAAPPFPALMAGKRLAMIDVDRGMIVVSSSYSASHVSPIQQSNNSSTEVKISCSIPSFVSSL